MKSNIIYLGKFWSGNYIILLLIDFKLVGDVVE